MKPFKRNNIGIVLQELGCLTDEQIARVKELLGVTKQRFGEICLSEGMISEEDLARALAKQFGMEYFDLENFRMDEELLNSLPTDCIFRFRFVPLKMAD